MLQLAASVKDFRSVFVYFLHCNSSVVIQCFLAMNCDWHAFIRLRLFIPIVNQCRAFIAGILVVSVV